MLTNGGQSIDGTRLSRLQRGNGLANSRNIMGTNGGTNEEEEHRYSGVREEVKQH
jgi:hypothetical protein